jgi:DDE_Tnp_1-associated
MKTEELGPSLLRALAEVPDPRSRHGRRHPLPAVLALATLAMLSGARSLYAIAQWGREQPEGVVRTLGFTRQQTPGVATLHRVFKRLDVEVFETVLAHWAQAALGECGHDGEVIAIDGKALRGIHGEQLPGVRLVAAYDVQTGLVLAQKGGEGPHRGAYGAGADR